MEKSRELTEKELKEVIGGADIADGYFYFNINGKDQKVKIKEHEKDLKILLQLLKKQELSDKEIIERMNIFFECYLGPIEDC